MNYANKLLIKSLELLDRASCALIQQEYDPVNLFREIVQHTNIIREYMTDIDKKSKEFDN